MNPSLSDPVTEGEVVVVPRVDSIEEMLARVA